MFIDDYLPLEQLLPWVDKLAPDLEDKYKLRTILIPRWKNFLNIQVDRFDRYPEMVTHGSIHVCNVFELASELLVSELKDWNRKNNPPITGEELFLLIAAIFLHDIGMADIVKSTDKPNEVRRIHSRLTGEILKERFRGRERYETQKYESLNFENLLPTFKNENEVDVLAEICIHHQSKAPIAKKDEHAKITAPSLEYICNYKEHLHCFNGKEIDICFVTALLRFLDVCDTQYSRTGSIFVSSSKIKNNKRLIKECEERRKKSVGELKNFYEEYGKYLRAQEEEHFPKHSVIQKVWIIEKKVVYKPITYLERKLLSRVMTDAAFKPEPFIKLFRDDLRKELSVCNEYLKRRGLNITGIRQFNEQSDPALVARLSSYDRVRRGVPHLNKPYMERRGFEGRIVSQLSDPSVDNNLILFVGPKGIGKTCLARKLAGDLEKKKRVCFITFDGWKKGKEEDFLHFIITQMIYFLASWGDFLFYNKLRMEMDIEEGQWSILIDQLDHENHLFIFDDLHLVPLQKRSSPIFRFFKQFFEKICRGKGQVIIFTRKIPHPLTMSLEIPFIKQNIPVFRDAEIERIIERPRYVKFNSKEWVEGRTETFEILQKYNGLPIVLDFIRQEADLIPQEGKMSASRLAVSISGLMRRHIQSIREGLEREAKILLDYLLDNKVFVIDDLVIEKSGMQAELVKKGRSQLEWRNFLKPSLVDNSIWNIDLWWSEIGHPFNKE